MSTSLYGGRILFDATHHDNNETLSADLARTVASNVLHACDGAAQVRVSIPPDDGDGFPGSASQLTLTATERTLMARLGPFPLSLGADGRTYPCRIRLAATNDAAGTNVLICYLHPYRAWSLSNAAAASFSVTSTTTAWYDALIDNVVWPSAALTAEATERLYTLDATGGNPVDAQWPLFMLSIYGQIASGTAQTVINGGYLAEYCGFGYDPLVDLPNLVHAYEAATCEIDGSTNVSSWTDLVGTEHLTPPGNAPAYNYNDSNFLDRATITFDRANSEYLEAPTAAEWGFLHDGTDWTALVVARQNGAAAANEYVWATSTGASDVGTQLIVSSSAYAVLRVNNGTGTSVVNASSSPTTVTDSAVVTWVSRFSATAATGTDIREDDTQIATDTSYSGDFSGAAPDYTLNVGASGAGGSRFDGEIAAIYFCKQYLTDAQLDDFQLWATAKFGA